MPCLTDSDASSVSRGGSQHDVVLSRRSVRDAVARIYRYGASSVRDRGITTDGAGLVSLLGRRDGQSSVDQVPQARERSQSDSARPTTEVVMSSTAETASEIRPFQVDVPDDELADLRRRIAATRLPTK